MIQIPQLVPTESQFLLKLQTDKHRSKIEHEFTLNFLLIFMSSMNEVYI